MRRETATGIEVIIVGAGLGGLYAAVECHRQGHSVTVLESRARLDPIGESAAIQGPMTSLISARRRLCRHRAVCNEAIPQMARHGQSI